MNFDFNNSDEVHLISRDWLVSHIVISFLYIAGITITLVDGLVGGSCWPTFHLNLRGLWFSFVLHLFIDFLWYWIDSLLWTDLSIMKEIMVNDWESIEICLCWHRSMRFLMKRLIVDPFFFIKLSERKLWLIHVIFWLLIWYEEFYKGYTWVTCWLIILSITYRMCPQQKDIRVILSQAVLILFFFEDVRIYSRNW